MLKISKVAEPDFLKAYKRKYNPKNWDDYNEDRIKFELKTFIAENEQNINDVTLCVYCEREIDIINNKGHIEHIRPKDKFHQLFQEYDNLSIACDSHGTCGHAKQNKYDNRFINPVEDNPKEFLAYDDLTGEIIAKDNSVKDRVDYTVNEVLKLNEYSLCKARKTLFIQLGFITKPEELDSIVSYYKSFSTLLNYYRTYIFNHE